MSWIDLTSPGGVIRSINLGRTDYIRYDDAERTITFVFTQNVNYTHRVLDKDEYGTLKRHLQRIMNYYG